MDELYCMQGYFKKIGKYGPSLDKSMRRVKAGSWWDEGRWEGCKQRFVHDPKFVGSGQGMWPVFIS